MKIKKIKLTNFRLHQNLEIDTDAMSVVIVGNNASGKTTIVESLYYCCFFTSFRIRKNEELITFGNEVSSINLQYEQHQKLMLLDTYFNKTKRNIVYNGQKGQKRIDMMGNIKVLLLTPNSDELVSSSPKKRRNYLDMYISQYNSKYRLLLSEYQKLTKQRAACLKAKVLDQPTLEIITERYDLLITQLREIRSQFLAEIDYLAGSIVSLLSRGDDQISLAYKASKKEDVNKEVRYQKNLYGLQYDDFDILINGVAAKTFASQGQARSIAMALILAQIELIYQKYNDYPIVIIDDVHVELDTYRQAILFDLLSTKVQAFFVSTSLDNMPAKINQNALKYHLTKDGQTSKIKQI